MDQLFEDLSSPYWWVSAVCIGILINVFAAFLVNPIRNLFGRFSETVRARNQRRQEEDAKRIISLAEDPEDMSHLRYYLNLRYMTIGTLTTIAGVGIVLLLITQLALDNFSEFIDPNMLLDMRRTYIAAIVGLIVIYVSTGYFLYLFISNLNIYKKARRLRMETKEWAEKEESELKREEAIQFMDKLKELMNRYSDIIAEQAVQDYIEKQERNDDET